MGLSSLSKTTDLEQVPGAQTVDQTANMPQFSVIGFYGVAVLFNICLSIQVLTVGLAYFADTIWWQTHSWLVRGYSGLAFVLLVWAYVLPFSQRIRLLTVIMVILLGCQFLTIHWHPSFLPLPLAIGHPFIGFSLVSVSSTLVHRVWRMVSPKQTTEINSI